MKIKLKRFKTVMKERLAEAMSYKLKSGDEEGDPKNAKLVKVVENSVFPSIQRI